MYILHTHLSSTHIYTHSHTLTHKYTFTDPHTYTRTHWNARIIIRKGIKKKLLSKQHRLTTKDPFILYRLCKNRDIKSIKKIDLQNRQRATTIETQNKHLSIKHGTQILGVVEEKSISGIRKLPIPKWSQCKCSKSECECEKERNSERDRKEERERERNSSDWTIFVRNEKIVMHSCHFEHTKKNENRK